MENWSSGVIEFNPVIIDESERIIEGVASAPVYDRANELITADALKRAVPDYMILPIVTVGHKEFIAGVVKSIWFDDTDRMNIRVQLKPTEDVTPVWELIQKGYLNAFSIAGSRKSSTCHVNSNGVSSTPCITDSITLNSITICGSDKCNQEAHFAIAKALGLLEETMTEEAINDMEKTVETEQPTVSTETTSFDYVTLAKALAAEMAKGCSEDKPEEKKEDDEKEDMKKSISELKELIKTQADTLNTLSARLEKIESIPFEKSIAFKEEGGHIIAVSSADFQKSIVAGVTSANAIPAVSDARVARNSVFRG